MGLVGIGVAAGLGISACLTRLIATLPYSVRPIDALAFTAVSVLLLAGSGGEHGTGISRGSE